jgi:hypothetical protein
MYMCTYVFIDDALSKTSIPLKSGMQLVSENKSAGVAHVAAVLSRCVNHDDEQTSF